MRKKNKKGPYCKDCKHWKHKSLDFGTCPYRPRIVYAYHDGSWDFDKCYEREEK